MSENETTKDEEPKEPTDPTVNIEDLDVTNEEDVKGGRTRQKELLTLT